MSTMKFLLLLIPLVANSTQGYLIKKPHTEDTVNNSETYLEKIKTIAEDVKDTLQLKKQAVVDGVTAIGNAKLDLIHNIKDSKKNLIQSILASQMAQVNAMKAAKEEFMKKIMEQKQPMIFFLQNKLHNIKEAVPTLPPIEGVKSRLYNFFLQFFNKFQGHFKKHDKFTFLSHPSSDSYPQIQGIAVNAQDSEPQMNFFPSEVLPSEITPPTNPSSDYLQPVQSTYEFDQIEDAHHGLQPSEFSPPMEYYEPKDDFAPSSDFSTVDFTDQQKHSHLPSSYYDSYTTSANHVPAATYGLPN